jgi:hypothetical protein
MRTVRNAVFCLLLVWSLVIGGCGGSKKADENKPLPQVKAEADKMNAAQLHDMAMKYKEAIEARNADVDKIAAKLKEILPTEAAGGEMEQLKTDLENLMKSVSALQERFQVYYQKLKEKGGDLSGLEI